MKPPPETKKGTFCRVKESRYDFLCANRARRGVLAMYFQHRSTGSRYLHLLLACTFIPLAGGCARDESPTRRREHVAPLYDPRICAVPRNRGGEAIFSQSNEERPAYAKFFGKSYNRAHLDAILTSSAISTAKFVSLILNGRLYRIQREFVNGERVCPMFIDLPEPPEELLMIWDRQVAGMPGTSSRLAGLYFEYCTPGRDCSDTAMVLPTILIDDGRDRWTLVHEVMHFNFDRERKKDANQIGDERLERDAIEAKRIVYENYSTYSATRDRSALSQLQNRLSWLIRVFVHQNLIRTTFEEVAVEGTLLNEYLAGKLKYVAPVSADNAVWYMKAAFTEGSGRYDLPVFSERNPEMPASLNALNDFVLLEARRHGWRELADQARRDRKFIVGFLEETQSQIEALTRRYENTSVDFGDSEVSTGAHGPDEQFHDHLPGAWIFERWKRL